MVSLFKRGDQYYARHTYTENGKKKDVRRSLETDNETVAKRRMRAVQVEVESGKWGEPSKMRFAELVRRFRIERREVIKPNTMKRYEVSLKKLMGVFGDAHIGTISIASVSNFVSGRRKDPGRNGKGKVTDASIRADLACLGAILSFGVMKGVLAINPVPPFLKQSKRDIKRGPPRERYLSHDEERRLLMACINGIADQEQYRNTLHDAVQFAIETGLRLREQFDLELRDVQITGRAHVVVRETKSGRPRKVHLSQVAHEIVSRQRGQRYVFELNGKRIGDLDRGFKAAAARAGVHDIQWHDLRRTCGCRLLQDKGATIVQVRDILGHSSVVVTEKHYAFLRSDDLHDVMNRTAISPVTGNVLELKAIGGRNGS